MSEKDKRKQVAFNTTQEFHTFLKIESAKRGLSIKDMIEKAVDELVKKYELK